MGNLRARDMRKRMPAGEARLWNLLRQPPLKAFHFRRQVPFAQYYADFASHLAKVIIEVDGSQHAGDQAMSYDAQRTAFLESRGYRVLRFANADVLNHLDGVFLVLAAELRKSEPPPTGFAGPPSPQGGGSADCEY